MQEVTLNLIKHDFNVNEAYKTLRTNIELSGQDIKTICLTSTFPGEGKSTTSFEIARTFAESGKAVLLIDADMRKSAMERNIKSGEATIGLTNYLAGQVSGNDCLCRTNVPNLWMIFSGPVAPNPSELLGSPHFVQLLDAAKKKFDLIIIDTPPLGWVIDMAVAAKVCDGAILVIEAGAISYRFARQVKEQLETTGCKILGCVLNKIDLNGKSPYGKYYGRYYGKYYGKAYGKTESNAEKGASAE